MILTATTLLSVAVNVILTPWAKLMEAMKDIESPPSMIRAYHPGRVLRRGVERNQTRVQNRRAPPVVQGGSSADSDLSGAWRQFSTNKISSSGYFPVVLAHGRYVRSSGQSCSKTPSGKITEINGTRTILVDGKPVSVYNEWYVVFEREARGTIIPSNSTGITVSHSLLSLQDGRLHSESLGGEKLEGNVPVPVPAFLRKARG